jgi:DNA-binding response OmpR family regulator
VEDNPDIAEPLGQTLTSAGYQVDIANSFRAALSADRRGVDLVLSDLELPDGSGIELVRRLRERRPVVAIALSGYASPRHVQACREAGFVAHFRKPLDLPALMTAIEAATRRAGPKRVRVNPGTQRRGGSDDGLRSGEA